MGAWGMGPFDSDGALDYLGDLAHRHATIGEDDWAPKPGTVDHAAVVADLTATLTGLDAETASWDCDAGYAAAGLVAAALADVAPANGGGTRLLAGMSGAPVDDLGLSSHAGYVTLLTRADADQLRPAAVAAVDALVANIGWLERWYSDIEPLLHDLRRALQAGAPAGT